MYGVRKMEKLKQIKKWAIEQVMWAERELKGKTGAEKRAAVVAKLDDMIKLPSRLEWVDDIILGIIVDNACKVLNDFAGHKFANVVLTGKQEDELAEKVEGGF